MLNLIQNHNKYWLLGVVGLLFLAVGCRNLVPAEDPAIPVTLEAIAAKAETAEVIAREAQTEAGAARMVAETAVARVDELALSVATPSPAGGSDVAAPLSGGGNDCLRGALRVGARILSGRWPAGVFRLWLV